MKLLALLLAGTVASAQTQAVHPSPNEQPAVISIEKEIALRKSVVAEYERRQTFSHESELIEYVAGIARKFSPSVVVRVIDSRNVLAAALPGEHVYVSTGLLARADNEAEFAGVLAHEIAHTRTRPLEARRGSGIVMLWLEASGGLCGRFGNGLPLGAIDSFRERERHADRSAFTMLRDANYEPTELLSFFSKLRFEEPTISRVMNAEDLTAERGPLEGLEPPQGGYLLSTSEFEAAQRRVLARRANTALAKKPSLFKRQP